MKHHYIFSLLFLFASFAAEAQSTNGTPDPNGKVQPNGTPDPNGKVQPNGTPDPNGKVQPNGTPDPNGKVQPNGPPDPNGEAQPKIDTISGSFQFKYDVPKEYGYIKDIKDNTNYSIVKNAKVTVLYELNNEIHFSYWKFSESQNKELNEKIFKISKQHFKSLTIPLYRQYKGVNVGVYTIPFRLRGIGGDNFDFESSLSLQGNLVFGFGRMRKKESYFDLSLGMGLTAVGLNAQNSKVTDDRTASALTLSFGALVKPSQNANIGLFIGWDFLGRKDQEVEWVHNRKTWIGLGININFNGIETSTPSRGTEQ